MTVCVGFLGCGFIASYHAGMLARSQAEVTVAAVFDPDTARAEQFAARLGARAVESEDAVIEVVDAVYVATWTSEHRRLVEKVVAAGRAVFCEKPLAVTGHDARAMAAAVDAAGVTNQVGLVLRDSPAFLLLRRLVQQPASGRLMTVVFRDDQFLPISGLYGSTWRADVTKAGAGTLLEHSIHDLDLLTWIGGPVATVSAQQRNFHDLDGIEDLAVVTLGFASGAVATLTSVWHDVLSRPSMRHVEVFCERAYYVLEGDSDGPVRWTIDEATGRNAVDGWPTSGSLEGDALRAQVRAWGLAERNPDAAFVEAVANGDRAYPSLADALPAHQLADAVYRSAADPDMSGRTIAVTGGSDV